MKNHRTLFVALLLLALCMIGTVCRGQQSVAIGRSTRDIWFPPFFTQNTNAQTLVLGMNAFAATNPLVTFRFSDDLLSTAIVQRAFGAQFGAATLTNLSTNNGTNLSILSTAAVYTAAAPFFQTNNAALTTLSTNNGTNLNILSTGAVYTAGFPFWQPTNAALSALATNNGTNLTILSTAAVYAAGAPFFGSGGTPNAISNLNGRGTNTFLQDPLIYLDTSGAGPLAGMLIVTNDNQNTMGYSLAIGHNSLLIHHPDLATYPYWFEFFPEGKVFHGLGSGTKLGTNANPFAELWMDGNAQWLPKADTSATAIYLNLSNRVHTLTLTHNVTFHSTNRLAGVVLESYVIITASGGNRTIAVNPDWTNLVSMGSITLTNGHTAILSIICRGASETDVISAYATAIP
jgi:hypothetical protein